MLPVDQHSFGPGFDQRIGTDEKDFAIFVHLLTHRGGVHPQLRPCRPEWGVKHANKRRFSLFL